MIKSFASFLIENESSDYDKKVAFYDDHLIALAKAVNSSDPFYIDAEGYSRTMFGNSRENMVLSSENPIDSGGNVRIGGFCVTPFRYWTRENARLHISKLGMTEDVKNLFGNKEDLWLVWPTNEEFVENKFGKPNRLHDGADQMEKLVQVAEVPHLPHIVVIQQHFEHSAQSYEVIHNFQKPSMAVKYLEANPIEDDPNSAKNDRYLLPVWVGKSGVFCSSATTHFDKIKKSPGSITEGVVDTAALSKLFHEQRGEALARQLGLH